MPRIGTLISSVEQFLLIHLSRVNQATVDSAIKLATGNYVNAPQDDPSAFMQIQNFQRQLSVVTDVKTNVDAAATVGAESQVTLDEIRTQLTTIRDTLELDEAGDLTAAERDANQAIIHAAIDDIRSLARTSIAGKRYFDGSFNYSFSGKNPAQIKNIEVFALDDDTTISGTVTTAATKASVTYTGAAGNINGSGTFTLTGKRGATTISVTNGEALTAARDRINAASHDTGITASVSGNDLILSTVDYGDNATINVNVTAGAFATAGTTAGTDAVVTINGQAISSDFVDGNVVSYQESGAHLSVELQAGYAGALSSVTISDDSVARFSLAIRISDQTKYAIPSLFPEVLGGVSGTLTDLDDGGTLAGLGSNTSAALRVIEEALAQIDVVEGRIDAFADVTVASAGRLMDAFQEELESSLENINTVDPHAESLVLARNQTLAANTAAAMSILQQQQSYILSIFRQQAGLD